MHHWNMILIKCCDVPGNKMLNGLQLGIIGIRNVILDENLISRQRRNYKYDIVENPSLKQGLLKVASALSSVHEGQKYQNVE